MNAAMRVAFTKRDAKSLVGSLIDLQIGFSTCINPSAASYLERASILYGLGFMPAAMADAEKASAIDPADPMALALQCVLAALLQPQKDKHHQALALLQSQFAADAERRLALPAVDPAQLPILLRLELPLHERLTVITRPSDVIQFSGNGAPDDIASLAKSPDGTLHIVDFRVKRHATDLRVLHVRLNDTQHVVEVMPLALPAPAVPQPGDTETAPIWVIMPLKDGGTALRGAIESLLTALEDVAGARVILVDDASTDPETLTLLDHVAKRTGVRVVRSARQLGFTAAVNLGLRHVGRGPVLLLNSDVWVARHSISRMLAYLDDADIGTVTPLSNNAGSFCLLGHSQPFPMPPPVMCENLAQAAYAVNAKIAVDVPSGNGFAMLISDACLRATAPFSGVYDSGYYEEVDFCLRAAMRGWRNVAATDCFIGHIGSVTYGAQKQWLVAANLRRLLRLYPRYAQTYAAFDALDPLSAPRTRILQTVGGATFFTPEVPSAGPHMTVTLPSQTGIPVVLPCTDTVPGGLLHRRFRSLWLCRKASLSTAGLTVDPGHQLYLTPAPTKGCVSLHDGTGTPPILHFQSSDAEDADFATFEATVLQFHNHRQAFGATHAISV